MICRRQFIERETIGMKSVAWVARRPGVRATAASPRKYPEPRHLRPGPDVKLFERSDAKQLKHLSTVGLGV
jgi:hypothetical protein